MPQPVSSTLNLTKFWFNTLSVKVILPL